MNWKKIFLIIIITAVIVGGGIVMFNRTNKKIVNYAYSFNKFNKVSVDIPTFLKLVVNIVLVILA